MTELPAEGEELLAFIKACEHSEMGRREEVKP